MGFYFSIDIFLYFPNSYLFGGCGVAQGPGLSRAAFWLTAGQNLWKWRRLLMDTTIYNYIYQHPKKSENISSISVVWNSAKLLSKFPRKIVVNYFSTFFGAPISTNMTQDEEPRHAAPDFDREKMSFVIPKIDEQWGKIDIELLEIYNICSPVSQSLDLLILCGGTSQVSSPGKW